MKYKIFAVVFLLSSLEILAGGNVKKIDAYRVTNPPVVDGILDELIWSNTQAAKDFIQRDPLEGEPASEATEVRVLYDDEALYFGCIMFK
ncbi:MAG: hypothetical protein QME58_10055 [Bacteroidota bacterium]|nr:hypothetical protein [Bacteroidota bacterium]